MNGWPGQQVCYCDNCRRIGDPHSPAYRQALLDSALELKKDLVAGPSDHMSAKFMDLRLNNFGSQ